mgnify:CR=1 FL=1
MELDRCGVGSLWSCGVCGVGSLWSCGVVECVECVELWSCGVVELFVPVRVVVLCGLPMSLLLLCDVW